MRPCDSILGTNRFTAGTRPGCSTNPPPRDPAPESTRISDHALGRTSGAELREGNSLVLLRNGYATFADWLRAIRGAERWIHLENYIFFDGEIGRAFADALAERVEAGVTVRVLYDWYGSWDANTTLWRDLRAKGVDVRTINPPQLSEPLGVLRRDHRKLLAVDGVYGSVGGVGIADPWLHEDPESGLPYRDTCVAVTGPAVADIEAAFAGVWDLNGTPLPDAERPKAEEIAATGQTRARVLIQEPGKMRVSRLLQVLTASVEDRIWIADAYFLADRILREALIAAALDGIDVRLLLPSTNGLRLFGAISRASVRPLLEAGARIWEYSGPMMHAKTIIADGWCARVGSTNLNLTGLMTNWEIDVIVQDVEFGLLMEEMFLDDLNHAEELTLDGRKVRGGSGRRRMRGLATGAGPQGTTSVASLGTALAQGALSDALSRSERKFDAGAGAAALVGALVIAKFPRLFALPVAAVLGMFAATGLARALRIGRHPRGTGGPARNHEVNAQRADAREH